VGRTVEEITAPRPVPFGLRLALYSGPPAQRELIRAAFDPAADKQQLLTLQQAAWRSGLSEAELREAIELGELRSRFARTDTVKVCNLNWYLRQREELRVVAVMPPAEAEARRAELRAELPAKLHRAEERRRRTDQLDLAQRAGTDAVLSVDARARLIADWAERPEVETFRLREVAFRYRLEPWCRLTEDVARPLNRLVLAGRLIEVERRPYPRGASRTFIAASKHAPGAPRVDDSAARAAVLAWLAERAMRGEVEFTQSELFQAVRASHRRQPWVKPSYLAVVLELLLEAGAVEHVSWTTKRSTSSRRMRVNTVSPLLGVQVA